jgi:hypothetical protein
LNTSIGLPDHGIGSWLDDATLKAAPRAAQNRAPPPPHAHRALDRGTGFGAGGLNGAVECPDTALAIQRAELMTRNNEIAGSIALPRRGNPDTEENETAVILKAFGEIPPDFDIG